MAATNITIEEASAAALDITIKEEFSPQIEEESFEVKTETEDITENPYEHSELQVKEVKEIKDELTVSIEQDDSQSGTEVKDFKNEETETESILPTSDNVELKIERAEEENVASYDYPCFEDSMDSSEAAALSHVEACLSDEINIKSENYIDDESQKDFPRIIKDESELTVTETHLISNKLINTTSTITSTHDGIIQSQTTKTLIMEIHPMTLSNEALKMGNPEEILPTLDGVYDQVDYEESFQLNSITGNFLSLEQEAYGLLKTKRQTANLCKTYINCPKCPKICNGNSALKRHLKVHEGIEKRAMGHMRGLQKRLEKKRKLEEEEFQETNSKQHGGNAEQQRAIGHIRGIQKRLEKQRKLEEEELQEANAEQYMAMDHIKGLHKRLAKKRKLAEEEFQGTKAKEHVKKEDKEKGYKCTCGKAFQRRSRMETCLRSHTDFAGSSSYACLTCDQKFKSKDLLTFHRNRQHRKKYPCKFCPTDYHTQKELFKHLRIHQKVQLMEYKVISEVANGEQNLQCLLCTKTCSNLSDLQSHIMEGHKEPYNCPHCSQIFTKIVDFANHAKKTHPDVGSQSVLDVLGAFSKLVKAWKCDTCGEQFHKADKLALHQVEEHTPDMKNEQHFQCGDCQRVFISRSGLNSHMRMHHRAESAEVAEPAEVGVLCLECRKICQDMNALTSHMRLHSMERRYPCKFCDFRFATPHKRKAHAEIHTGDMKYVCFICEYQCSSENRLKQHKMSLKHLNMKEYLLTGKPLVEEEQSTSKKQKIKDTLRKKEWGVKKKKRERKDKERDEDIEIACDICGEKFTSEAEMQEHKQTHPFIEFPNDDKPSRIFFK